MAWSPCWKEPQDLLTTILTEIWFHCWKEILVEIRGYNVYQSGEFSFSGLHSTKLALDGQVLHISGIERISGSPQALPNLRFIHSVLNKSTIKVASREPQRSLEGASKEPQDLLTTIFQLGFLSSSETIFLSNFEAPLRLL